MEQLQSAPGDGSDAVLEGMIEAAQQAASSLDGDGGIEKPQEPDEDDGNEPSDDDDSHDEGDADDGERGSPRRR
jgi:hypothetical protein